MKTVNWANFFNWEFIPSQDRACDLSPTRDASGSRTEESCFALEILSAADDCRLFGADRGGMAHLICVGQPLVGANGFQG
ncbi:MAG: hypothetical protein WCA45_01485 [Thiobacillaceae bacterium]